MAARNFEELLTKRLQDPKEAVAYLNTALLEVDEKDKESQKVLLLVLRDIVNARGGISEIAEKTGLGRESLYKTLSLKGNPQFSTVLSIVRAVGLELTSAEQSSSSTATSQVPRYARSK